MGYSGNLYAQATEVISSQGDLRRGDSSGNPERLAIGSSGKVLQSNGTTESWETIDLADTVLTTSGDLLYENSVPELARLAKGTQYNNLQMGSALPAWASSSTSILSASGDILYASGANTLAKLAKATDGDTLQLASGVPAWVTVSAGGATVESVKSVLSSTFTSTSSSYVDTGLTITKPNITDGKCIITAGMIVTNSVGGNSTGVVLDDDGTIVSASTRDEEESGVKSFLGLTDTSDTDGNTAKIQTRVSGGEMSLLYVVNYEEPTLCCLGVG